LRATTRVTWGNSETERSPWGRQDGVGPVTEGRAGTAAFVENEGHEGFLFYGPHWIISGQSLNPPHYYKK